MNWGIISGVFGMCVTGRMSIINKWYMTMRFLCRKMTFFGINDKNRSPRSVHNQQGCEKTHSGTCRITTRTSYALSIASLQMLQVEMCGQLYQRVWYVCRHYVCAYVSLWPDWELSDWLLHFSPCSQRLFPGFRNDCRGSPEVERW